MTAEQLQEKFQAYLDGTLLPEEKIAFEAQINASEPLKEELNKFRQLRILHKNESLLQAKSVLGKVMDEVHIEPNYGNYAAYFKETGANKAIKYWASGIFAILLIAGAMLFFQNKQLTKQLHNLANTNLAPMENLIGFANEDKSITALGMKAYDKKEYKTAIDLLQKAITESPDDGTLRLYLAISYLMLEQNTAAKVLLSPLTNVESLSTIPAKWYLALCLLKEGEKTEARKILLNLKSDKVYGVQAEGILKNENME
jgi:tetratricopeptide (TPR) repeat protein